jgi:hypothetical protein
MIRVTTRGPLFDGTAQARATTAVRGWLQGVLRKVRDDVRAGTPVDTGALRRSIVYRTRSFGGRVSGTVYSTASDVLVRTVEEGRRAGAKMPPAGRLLGWMLRKGIPAEKEFVVRRGIGERGIPGKFMFQRGFIANRGLLNSQRRYLENELVRRLS